MNSRWQLAMNEVRLSPAAEWMADAQGWRLLRLGQGQAYWLDEGRVQTLGPGDVLVCAPCTRGVVRVSQLGEAVVQHFHFSAESLIGLLTLTERQHLEKLAGEDAKAARHFPADHPVALEFAALGNAALAANPLLQRCRLLALIASVFGAGMPRAEDPPHTVVSARHRFAEIAGKMPEAEIINHSPEELARLCGCSVRHFSRLFQHHFGTSVRALQTGLRLQKARRLLAETDEKVLQVALESGFHHLGLFNAMFKKHFGLTPSQWRRQQAPPKRPAHPPRRTSGIVSAIAVAWAALQLVAAGYAQTAAATNRAPAFEVKGYDLTGNTLLPGTITGPIFARHVGTNVTFEVIRAALADLQMAYRDRGYVTVSVGLPQQQLTNGIVKVQVTEGRLAEINVVNNRYFSSNNVMAALPTLHTHELLNNLLFQQDLERANASKDRQIYPVIEPGPEPGTSTLTLKVKDRLPLHGRIELDNYALPNTPDLRFNTSLQYNNLWQLEHQLGLQYSFAPDAFREKSPWPAVLDQSMFNAYSVFYRLPLHLGRGARSQREFSLSDFGYDEATRRFRPPPAGTSPELLFFASRSVADTGSTLSSSSLNPATVATNGTLQVSDQIYSQTVSLNEGLGARWLMPLPEVQGIRASLSAGLDYKFYKASSTQNRTFQATVYVPPNPPGYVDVTQFAGYQDPAYLSAFTNFPSPPNSSTRSVPSQIEYLPLSLGLDASRADKTGFTSFNWNQSLNLGGVFSDSAAFRQLANSPQASSRYYVSTMSLSREQKLYGLWSVLLRADGQWASTPLISNEQFALGGNAGPRAYRDGLVYSDAGWRVAVEPHTPWINLGMVDGTLPMVARFAAFTDFGQGFLLDRNRPNVVAGDLWSTGFTVNSAIGERWDFKLACGWTLNELRYAAPPGATYAPAGALRITFSAAFQF